jgi:signal transduction histidine kinase
MGRSAWLAATLLVFAVLSATAAEPERVLFLRSFGRDVPPYDTFAAYLRTDLAARSPAPLDIYEVPVEVARSGSGQEESKFVDYLLALSADHPPDLVVPIGAPAVRFAQRFRGQLFPSTPLLFAAVDERMLLDPALTANDAVVPVSIDLPGFIENILRVQPQTTTVAVAIGNSPVEKLWVEAMRHEFDPFARRVEILYFNQLPFEETLTRAATLPPHSAIFFADVQEDGHGVPHSEEQTLGGLRAVANAPIFGLYDYQLGRGIVGGSLIPIRRLSHETAEVAARILRGEAPGQFRTPALRPDAPVFDSRELQRWGVAEANLPPNSTVEFQEPTAWEKYRPQILGGVAIIALQMATIAALIVQSRRRRRTQQELAGERLELAHVSRRTQLGELSGAFAHELNQPLTSILANAEAGARLLRKEPLDTDELKEILGDIVEEDKRAAGVITQLRQLMTKGEAKLDPMDLNEAVTATIALARAELIARQTELDFNSEVSKLPVCGNYVQLQQLILNLVMNAADAMSNLMPSERRITIATRKREDGFRELTVSDRGPGFPAELREKAFNPFVSTKAKGLGLGLSICRSIALTHGGTLNLDEHKSEGARVILALPPA